MTDFSQSHNDNLASRLELLQALEAGNLDGLQCPDCGRPSVSVCFSRPCEGEYRTWFFCGSCEFHMRVQGSGRPKHFSPGRVDPGLEMYDDELLRTSRFPRPDKSSED